ncbi:diguanylate cyclase (GGDEF)-like protein [Paenibacillus phyllosphaerae]|uniref:Diguanylate cyclase (GGDEF)-like protein n=1 Tax=Paenibacillus phyllosphaerae TaxID=274593 RepID=A0A7W5FM30_9BACL|nr:EAL domain-containing protein [Paenibacillus phyllosphaerae]MBB3109559.1 diguanylate cyclase (GGDEF)-like protein [Paenibacillus phyllosphaerae]
MKQLEKPLYITESHALCRSYNLNIYDDPGFHEYSEEKLHAKLAEYEEVLSVTQYFIDQMLNSLVQQIPLLISVNDADGIFLQVDGSPKMIEKMHSFGFKVGRGFSPQDSGTNCVSIALQYNESIALVGEDHYHIALHGTACYAVPFNHYDGRLIGTISIMTAVEHHSPLYLAMLGTVVHSIERELQLHRQNKRLHVLNQIIMDTKRNASIITDDKGQIIDINEMAALAFHSCRADWTGKSAFQIPYIGRYFRDIIGNGNVYEEIEISMDEFGIVGLFDANPIVDDKGAVIGAYGQFRDITERYAAEARINYLAFHDELTSLPNRRMFIKTAQEEINKPKKPSDGQLAFMYLDLDRFKLVNDSLGHTEGDRLLKEVAIRLKSCIRENDLVARMGGDEFMFMLRNVVDEKEIARIAERVLNAFEAPFILGVHEFHVTPSMGIALYPKDGTDIETLMVQADSAMYQAKASGKNTFKFYDANMRTLTGDQLALETAMRRAIEQKQFSLHYQPQMDTQTGRLIGIEALIRWNHPTMGMIPPNRFIPLAEETGLILPIGEWVLGEACRQNKVWQEIGYPPVRMSINLSAAQFTKHDLIESISNTLRETELDPEYLELEITESMTMDVNSTVQTLHGLRQLGVQIAMDDFGTGYSSLNHLKRFGLHRLKIDQSFVRDIMTDTNDADIVGSIIVMAHRLGLRVIAEGVESKDQYEFLQEHMCDEVQGYYFSKPLPPEEVEKLLG